MRPKPVVSTLTPIWSPSFGFRVVLRAGDLDADLALRVADLLGHGPEVEDLDLAGLVVVVGLDLLLETVLAMRGLLHGLFERADDDALVDALVLGDLIDLSLQSRQHADSIPALTARTGRFTPTGRRPCQPGRNPPG